jgi:hypothetical protein
MAKKRADPNTVPVTELPANPHRLVAAWIAKDEEARNTARKYRWPIPVGQSATESGRRELRLHDALLKAGQRRGYIVEFDKFRLSSPQLIIHRQKIAWRMHERLRRRKVPLAKGEKADPRDIAIGKNWKLVDVPSGALVLFLSADYSSEQRIDEKFGKPLETQAENILDKMQTMAAYAAEQHEKYNQEWRRKIDAQFAAIRIHKLERQEAKRWARLRTFVQEVDEAAQLRQTVAAVVERMEKAGINPSRLAAWRVWAEARIDHIDPLRQDPEALFNRLVARPRVRSEEEEFDDDEEEQEAVDREPQQARSVDSAG